METRKFLWGRVLILVFVLVLAISVLTSSASAYRGSGVGVIIRDEDICFNYQPPIGTTWCTFYDRGMQYCSQYTLAGSAFSCPGHGYSGDFPGHLREWAVPYPYMNVKSARR